MPADTSAGGAPSTGTGGSTLQGGAGNGASGSTSEATGSGSGGATRDAGDVETAGGGAGAGGGTNIEAGVDDGGIRFDAGCVQWIENATPIATDIFILQDKSGSMECSAADDTCENPGITPQTPPTRWDAMAQAVGNFVNAPETAASGVAVGLGFFGLSDGTTPCTATSYATPVVPISAAPSNAKPITDAIAMTLPGGSTPTAPALQGAISYVRAYTMQQMGKRTATVLLVTDGNPTICGAGITPTVDAATAGFSGSPQVKTFVVGLGNTASLDQVALAGSGGSTHYIAGTGNVTAAVLKGLNAIAGSTACVYAMPSRASMPLDPSRIALQVKSGTTPVTSIGKLGGAASCGTQDGFYYDNPTAPNEIFLCPKTCDDLKASSGSVEIVYGCPTP